MATIITSGCFDVFHHGHMDFLYTASRLGDGDNFLVIFLNSDDSAKALKSEKHGPKYPIDSFDTRMGKIRQFVTEDKLCPTIIVPFSYESELEIQIRHFMPCILVKGPDYKGKKITGDDIAPVLILDTPEPESVKQMKVRAYSDNNPSQ